MSHHAWASLWPFSCFLLSPLSLSLFSTDPIVLSLFHLPEFFACFAGCPLDAALADSDCEEEFSSIQTLPCREIPASPWPTAMVRLGSCSGDVGCRLGAGLADGDCELEISPALVLPWRQIPAPPWPAAMVRLGSFSCSYVAAVDEVLRLP
jgi:hypothetical protein